MLTPNDTLYQMCDTSQTTIEKKAKEKVRAKRLKEKNISSGLSVEAVEIPPLSLNRRVL